MCRLKKISSYLLVVACLFFAAACPSPASGQAGTNRVTVFEGARLITGDGTAPIENSAFVVENNVFTQVGRQGEVKVPAGAARVNLTGKSVMPAKVDLHGHIGYQHDFDGTMAKEYFTRENLIDHLERLAYYGFSAIVGVGDLVDRSDLHGGRTNWGDVPLRVRQEIIPMAALFRTTGPGIAWPGSGANGHPSRIDVPYPVTTVDEARKAVQDYVRMKPEFIKIWVDDRGGRVQKLTPPLYLAIIEEAHKYNVPVAAHNVTLADAKLLMRAGVEGWLHLPVRGGEAPDAEIIALKLRAAGMKIVLGSDTGQSRFFIGWMGQLEFENWVRMGLTPAEAIVAATRDSAAAAHVNTGMVAAGKSADFIVLDANPLEDIANTRKINKVYLRGQEVDRARLRAKWQARWNRATSSGRK